MPTLFSSYSVLLLCTGHATPAFRRRPPTFATSLSLLTPAAALGPSLAPPTAMAGVGCGGRATAAMARAATPKLAGDELRRPIRVLKHLRGPRPHGHTSSSKAEARPHGGSPACPDLRSPHRGGPYRLELRLPRCAIGPALAATHHRHVQPKPSEPRLAPPHPTTRGPASLAGLARCSMSNASEVEPWRLEIGAWSMEAELEGGRK